MSAPPSIAAVDSNGLSILYYARENGQLAALTAQSSDQTSGLNYKQSDITLEDGSTVTAAFPEISAVSYTWGQGERANRSREIRLYYVGENKRGRKQLRELCNTNEGKWYPGALDDKVLSMRDHAVISANVEEDTHRLKVFFQQGEDRVPCVASANLGTGGWVVQSNLAPDW